MKKSVILVLMFVLFSLFVSGERITLEVTVESNDITFNWNNIFYEIPEPVCGDGTVDGDEECDDGNRENGDGCSIICEIEDEEAPGEPLESNSGLEILTTEAIKENEGFFSKIFNSVINVFRKLFGGETVSENISRGSYTLYKSINGVEEEIIQGTDIDFNCEETCTYSFEEEDGNYTYYIIASGKKISNNVRKIIGEGDTLECNIINNPCTNPNKECNEEGVCVDITSEVECSDTIACEDGKECVNSVCVVPEETCVVDEVDTENCEPFDLGICQKPQTKTRTCIEIEGELSWGEFSSCSIAEDQKCSEEVNNCESEMCDIDTNSCMPAEFEMEESDCEDGLDTDCDGDVDCEDSDCSDFSDCINNDPEPDDDPNNLGCEFDEECESNEICDAGECILDEAFFEDDTASRGSSNRGSSSRDVTGRLQNDGYDTNVAEGKGLSLRTWIIVLVIILFVGVAGIYLFIFKRHIFMRR